MNQNELGQILRQKRVSLAYALTRESLNENGIYGVYLGSEIEFFYWQEEVVRSEVVRNLSKKYGRYSDRFMSMKIPTEITVKNRPDRHFRFFGRTPRNYIFLDDDVNVTWEENEISFGRFDLWLIMKFVQLDKNFLRTIGLSFSAFLTLAVISFYESCIVLLAWMVTPNSSVSSELIVFHSVVSMSLALSSLISYGLYARASRQFKNFPQEFWGDVTETTRKVTDPLYWILPEE